MSNEKVVADEAGVDQQDTAEQNSAQTDEKSLDKLLDEFNSEFDKDINPESKDNVNVDADEVREFMAEYRQEQTNKAVSQAAKTVISALGDDLPVQVTDEMVTDLLYGRASRDQRFLSAFIQREKDPKSWTKVLGGLASKIKSDFGTPIDAKITQDRDAVIQTIRGKQIVEDEATDFSKWSDSRFNHWKLTGIDNPNL